MPTFIFSAKWNDKKTLFCNARELHKDLKCKTPYTNWIKKRILDCQLEANWEVFPINTKKLLYLNARAREFRFVKFDPNVTPTLWLTSKDIRRIVISSRDFTLAHKARKDYIISLNAAIQIAVLHKNADGRRVLKFLKSVLKEKS